MNTELLEAYIKRYIIAEQHTADSSNIIQAIINKFPSEYFIGVVRGFFDQALASNKRNVFWKRYHADEAFKNKVNNSHAYNKQSVFDFWLSWDELRKYLKPELQSAEILLIEQSKVSALRISDVRSMLEIAENVEEFKEMVKASAI